MRTRSGQTLDPLSPLPPSNVRPPRQQRRRPVADSAAPPPPPPPPLPAGVRPRTSVPSTQPANAVRDRAEVAIQATLVESPRQQAQQRNDWVLRLQIRREDGKPLTKVGVHVREGMNAVALAACLGQAVTSVGVNNNPHAMFNNGNKPPAIAGLFVERNGLFVSLEHLLSTPSLRSNTFGLTYFPPPPQPPPPTPWYKESWVWILASGPIVIGLVHWLFQWYGPQIWMASSWILSSLFDATVQLPLQELYRYGPWFIGWEGASLPAVCARITYYGDATFWRRNLPECESIYKVKEEAFLRVARPSLYAVLSVIVLWLLGQILRHFRHVARYRHLQATSMAPPPEMVDTYRAFQVLLRQVRKGMEQPTPPSGTVGTDRAGGSRAFRL